MCLALVTDLADRTRLRAALAGCADVTFVASIAEVLPLLRADRNAIRAVLLEARDVSGRPTAGLARQVSRLFPSAPVIGYCSLGAEASQDIVAFVLAGAQQLVFKHRDEHTVLLRTILRWADQARAAQLVLHQFGDRLPRRIRPLVEYCLAYPEDAHSVGQVARTLGINRRTLVNRCRAERFPAPGAVIAWCLLLLTAGLLATPNVTVEQIAMQLNFPSATALRNMLKRHTGLRPGELRADNALNLLCQRFLELIRPTP